MPSLFHLPPHVHTVTVFAPKKLTIMRLDDYRFLQEIGLILPTLHAGDYIDVRGVWPVYVRGSIRYELHGSPRGISLSEARDLYNAAH